MVTVVAEILGIMHPDRQHTHCVTGTVSAVELRWKGEIGKPNDM